MRPELLPSMARFIRKERDANCDRVLYYLEHDFNGSSLNTKHEVEIVYVRFDGEINKYYYAGYLADLLQQL